MKKIIMSSMRGLLLLVLLTPLILWSEPVSIYIDYEGKKLRANAEWSLRTHEGAQKEIREFAEAIKDMVGYLGLDKTLTL